MIEFHGDPVEVFLSQSPQTNLFFEANRCLENAYKMAKENNCFVVEGILITLENSKVIYANFHSWNKKDNQYFDVTKDHIWTKRSFISKVEEQGVQAENLTYKYLMCAEYQWQDSEIIDKVLSFKHSYNELLSFINSEINQ